MQRPHFPIALTALVAALLTSGCTARIGGDESDSKQSVTVVIGDSTAAQGPALGAGDVRIVSTDNVLVLSLIGDTVRMQLSDSLRNSVGAEIAKDADTSGLAGMITKSVSKVVTGAMGFMVRVPASEVENLRYEDGHIRFEIRNSDTKVKMKGNNGENAVFAEADAHRFIDAVKKRAARKIAM
jgi:hypothetical protein